MKFISSERYVELLSWLLLILFLISIFSVTTIHFLIDSTRYFHEAFKLYAEHSYTRAERGPMMAAFGAAAMLFSGGEPFGVLVLPRIAFLVAVLAFAGLVRSLYGWVGMPAAAFAFALTPIFHEISTQYHIDIFVVAVALLAVWAHYEALQRRSPILGVLSGLLLTIAFLTKEVTVLLVPLWLLAWVIFPPYDGRLRLVVVASLAAAFLAFLPWGIHIALDANLSNLLGRNVSHSGSHSSAFLHRIMARPLDFVLDVPGAVARFYRRNVFGPAEEQIDFGILIIVSQLVVLFRAILWHRKSDLYATAVFFCFVPLAVYLDFLHWDTRQSAIIQAMALLSVGALTPTILAAVRQIGAWSHLPRPAQTISLLLAGVVPLVIVASIAATNSYVRKTFTDQPRSYTLYAHSQYQFEPTGRVSRVMLQAGPWLEKHLAGKEKVMTSYARDAHQLDTILSSRQPLQMPVGKIDLKPWLTKLRATGSVSPNEFLVLRGMGRNASPDGVDNVILFWLNRADMRDWLCLTEDDLSDVAEIYCRIMFISESTLLDFVEKHNVRYIVTGDAFAVMTDYYDKNPSFRRVAEFTAETPYGNGDKERVAIHEVLDTQAAKPAEPIISETVPAMLQLFHKLHPNEFARWRDEVLSGYLHLSPAALESMYAGTGTCWHKRGSTVECVNAEDVHPN